MEAVLLSPDAPTSAPSVMTKKPRYRMPNLEAALKNESAESLGIAESTYWRWRAGDFPQVLHTLIDKPHLRKALALDLKAPERVEDEESE